MGRPVKWSGSDSSGNVDWASNVTWGPAGEMTGITHPAFHWSSTDGNGKPVQGYNSWNETRSYNVRGQLSRITTAAVPNPDYPVPPPRTDVEYRYSATANDGRITQMKNWVTGEEMNYSYDTLGRLSLAETTGTGWGQQFSYDGFGNLTAETATKGTPFTLSQNYDPATNRISGGGTAYDANGNQTAMAGLTLSYDVENRLTQSNTTSYRYDPSNQRVWNSQNDTVSLYSPRGELLANLTVQTYNGNLYLLFGDQYNHQPYVYFRGRRLWVPENAAGQVEDRLATANPSEYYPYGEPRPGSTGGQYATYLSAGNNLFYAMNRYYSSQVARFTGVDPFRGSAGPQSPQSWNRYAYVQGDPVNHRDRSGLMRDDDGYCPAEFGTCTDDPGPGPDYGCYVSDWDPTPRPACESTTSKPDPAPPQQDCRSDYAGYQVTFVMSHYVDSVTLGTQAGIPSTWVLGWSAEESGWGGVTANAAIMRHPNNYFSWHGTGDVSCPPGVSTILGCFSSYYAAGRTALFSMNNYFNYKGYPQHQGVTAGMILLDQYGSGANPAQAFQALRNAGYAADQRYGARVAADVLTVRSIEDCLTSLGKL